ncbi:MAG: hypothetical protein L6R40_001777 [Gallowayella cf. fulva]|nr:MAG: hypothetical protein L6R40_001777 [Xanthomendoza cf. fulva]
MPANFIKRKVSPLRFEALTPNPDEILCLGSDEEGSLDGHEAKRRRVEQAGEHYLRGRTLYIASARMRGPFTKGWEEVCAIVRREGETVTSRSRGIRRQSLHRHNRSSQVSRPSPHHRDSSIQIISHEKEGPAPAHAVQSCHRAPVEGNLPTIANEQKGTQDSFITATSEAINAIKQTRDAIVPSIHGQGWMKSAPLAAPLRKRMFEKTAKSPTPSPAPRQGEQTSGSISRQDYDAASVRHSTISRSKTSRSVASGSEGRRSRKASATQEITPAEGNSLQAPITSPKPSPVHSERSSPEPGPPVKELMSLSPETRKACQTAGLLSQEAPDRAQNGWSQHGAKKLPETTVSTIRDVSDGNKGVEIDTSAPGPNSRQSKRMDFTYAQPPSTNLPEFQYRYGPRESSHSPERSSFAADLEALKKKAKAEQPWRLSFTASGRVKDRSAKTSSRRSRASNPSQRSSAPRLSAEESPTVLRKQAEKPVSKENGDTTSGQTETFPEAQIVQEPGFMVPSGLSTGMLETEKLSMKFPTGEDGDSYLGLSTQAAMLKAQDSFNNGLVSPTSKRMDPALPRIDKHLDVQATDGNDDGSDVGKHPRPRPGLSTPGHDKEPLSTQDMMIISPFADTTIKKKGSPVTRLASSPSGSDLSSPLSQAAPNFENTTLSMSTSPSPTPTPATHDAPIVLSALSKPTSSVPSFSIAPNGTMTEVFQQDGQQQEPDYLMGDVDLDAALDEAGSFLGEWNLEKEARSLERSTAGSKASTAKELRSHD